VTTGIDARLPTRSTAVVSSRRRPPATPGAGRQAQRFNFPQERYLSEKGEALPEVVDTGCDLAIQPAGLTPACPSAGQASHWYAVYTSPRHEKRVAKHLGERAVEFFLPLYRTVHRWKNGCQAELELPLFPGYLFVKIGRRQRTQVLGLPGVIQFVGASGQPARLSDFEIEGLREAAKLLKIEPHRNLTIGQRVQVKSGPLTGLSGVLARQASGWRVVLSVSLINQSVAVELDAVDVAPIDGPSPRSSAFSD